MAFISIRRRSKSWRALCCLTMATLLAGCSNSPPAPTPHPEKPEPRATPPASDASSRSDPAPARPATGAMSAATPAGTAPDAQPAVELPPLPDPYEVPFENPVDASRAAAGWISLFDGHSLMGWTRHDDGANWSVQEGVITANEGPVDLLCTSVPFADYELEVDFRMEEGGNSGLFLRTLDRPQDVATDCYELNIADAHPEGFTTGSFVGRQGTPEPIAGSGGWKTFHVTAEGNQFTVYLDGHLVQQYVDESSTARAAGLIGLQKNKGKVEFRNLLLRPLGTKPLFNGTDLSGWRVVPGLKSEFTVANDAIHVKNGLGFLETEGTWADFLFQGDAQTHSDELNSGFFYRALPVSEGGNCDGYEVQIHNGFVDGDRSQPNNAGTGAIFRRVEARYVVPSDGEWFTTTFVASGPHVSVWVDGYQVVDWTDERPPNENPRRGLRLEPGHITLQGHDETTDISFRNLKLAELPR